MTTNDATWGRVRATGVVLLGTLTTGCPSEDPWQYDDDVTVWINPTADLSQYGTYAVLDELPPGSDPIPADVLANLDIVNSNCRAELDALGLEEVDPATETPDLWLFSLAASSEEDGYVYECVPGYTYWGWWYYWDDCAWLESVAVTYQVGTVAIGMADVAQEEVVFGGVAQGAIGDDPNPDRIREAMERIFNNWPQ